MNPNCRARFFTLHETNGWFHEKELFLSLKMNILTLNL